MNFIASKPKSVFSSEKIVYIGDKEDICAWELDTDYSKGGNSAASLTYDTDHCKSKTVKFSGRLQHFKELDYQGQLYCEIITTMLPKRMYRNSNGIRISVKTDGNNYVLGIVVRENMSFMNYTVIIMQALIQDTGGVWTDYELPLNNLISDADQENTAIRFDTDLTKGIKIIAVSLGIYSHQQQEGDFEILVKNIEVGLSLDDLQRRI